MSEERRQDERVQVNLPVRWNGESGTHDARIENLSLGGCFVDTVGSAQKGEIIVLEMRLPSGEWLPLRGEVTSVQIGLGFGISFTFLTDDEEAALRDLTF